MDEHVPIGITRALRAAGIDVLTVQEDGRSGVDDAAVLQRATELHRALFTQDTDLLVEAAKRQTSGTPFSGVIFGHQLSLTIGACVRDLELLAQVCDEPDLANAVVYLPLA